MNALKILVTAIAGFAFLAFCAVIALFVGVLIFLLGYVIFHVGSV